MDDTSGNDKNGFVSAPTLAPDFDNASKITVGESLDQIRHNFYVSASMSESDENSIGGININQSGRINSSAASKSKEKRATDSAMLAAILNSTLADLEASMVNKYGEDFAENLAAELLDEETYKRVMSIVDQDERRRQIAIEINQGLSDGSIDASRFNQNQDFVQWLDARDENEALMRDMPMQEQGTDLRSTKHDAENTHELSQGDDEATIFSDAFSGIKPTG